jgi:hypothetical protein
MCPLPAFANMAPDKASGPAPSSAPLPNANAAFMVQGKFLVSLNHLLAMMNTLFILLSNFEDKRVP